MANIKFCGGANERLANCIALSIENNDSSLNNCIVSMIMGFNWITNEYGEQKVTTYLYPDSCNEYSFYFVDRNENNEVVMNGGLLFHGFKGDKDTSFACTFYDAAWQIHT